MCAATSPKPQSTYGGWRYSCVQHSDDVREFKLTNERPMTSAFDYILCGLVGFQSLLLFYWNAGLVWYLFGLLVLFLRMYFIRNAVKEESLLVVRGLGLQISSRLYNGKEKKVFIEKKKIESIIINEGVQAWSILYYMAILVKGKEKMILPFEHVLPRLKVLLPIYRGTRALMYGEPEPPPADEDDENNEEDEQR